MCNRYKVKDSGSLINLMISDQILKADRFELLLIVDVSWILFVQERGFCYKHDKKKKIFI